MSFFGDFLFFGYLLLALLPAIILGLLEKNLKYYTLLLSLTFITVILFPTPKQLFYLALFCVLEMLLVKGYLLLRLRYGRKAWIYHLFLLFSLIPLVGNKLSGIVHISWFGFLGISYLTFRVVQVIIETYDGVITQLNLVEFFSFLLFFPSLSSGPIDRSRRFHEDYIAFRSRKEYLDLLGDGLMKLLLGMVYKFVLASLFSKLMEAAVYGVTWYASVSYAYCYGLNMFFDFAGYSLMAVGTSYILGVRTPDNFRLPFISKDIKDFWDRWHISLSHWFRDFIFSRFVMTAIKKKWFPTRLTSASVGFLVNMLIMGMWHGITGSYILYGLYHGVLLAFTEIYQKKVKFYKRNKQKVWYQLASWFITMQFVMFGFYIFSGRFLETLLH
ncbi:MAG: D-alanyl-lipoteichoic acid biosynthesis protein DltB [Lachnospiraceae bacterium]